MRTLAVLLLLLAACPGGTSNTGTDGPSETSTSSTGETTSTSGPTTGAPGTATAEPPTTGSSTGTSSATTGPDEPTTGTSESSSSGDPVEEPAIRYVGRHDDSDPDAVRMGWSGVGAVLTFDGTAVSVQIDGAANQFTVVVDGEVGPVLVTTPGPQSYPLAEDLPPGVHTVELYRRTEGFFGETILRGFELTGELLAPPPVTRRIAVIGDSITAGYGNEGEAPCSFSADTENHYNTYAAFAARTLGAELHAIAWSGKGVVHNYGDDVVEPMPELYDRLVAGDGGTTWDHARWQPDLVVVNLGTNDFSTDGDPPEDVFVPAYVAFVTHLREVNPDAFILLLAPLLFGDEATMVAGYLESVVAQRHLAGDLEVAFADINAPPMGQGCDGHPSAATHEAMGQALVAEIGEHLGW